ncbi:MAG TPA: hypothetical protein PKG48_00765 [Bacteroidales bacterium]|nr:hypothetical protein [Bacteroidales bacterium]HPS62033.1 hypothetical protein [Bacteroidales bacterium]
MKKSILPLLAMVMVFAASCKKDNSSIGITGDYAVFAWNDLGMHCLNPSYDELVILPPYNTVNVQVVKRGDPPKVLTSGITVEYRLISNTYSYGKRGYGGFWDNFAELFGGTAPAHDIGLTGTPLSGNMTPDGDHFTAVGIPVVPVDDAGTWNPFQVMEVKVKDGSGNVLAVTQATVPTSDEINCAKCHSGGSSSVFMNILQAHDNSLGTSLTSQKPVLCAKCHGSPALGTSGPGTSGKYLSQAIHGFHASKNAQCYDCHPGERTKCSRSLAHMGSSGDGNCTTCHGSLTELAANIASGTRIPWVDEPKCITCHSGVTGVETGSELYRNSRGHGGMYCTACHGSPHAMYPSREAADNYQPAHYQGAKIKTIGSCGFCHDNSRGEGAGGEFSKTHGGSSPDHKNTCHVCHTAVSATTSAWPHAYTWKNSNK